MAEEIVSIIKRELPLEQPYVTVLWYSVLMGITCEVSLFKEFVAYVRKNRKVFSANTQFYLYYQLKTMRFAFSKLEDECIRAEIWNFYREIVEEFAEKMTTPLEVIPDAERNRNLVLVITEQLVSIEHGPTKTALDRCKIVINKMIPVITIGLNPSELDFTTTKYQTLGRKFMEQDKKILERVRISQYYTFK